MSAVVKPVQTLVHTDEMRVVEFEQMAGSKGEWHYHSHVTESCYALYGNLRIEFIEGIFVDLVQGQKIQIEAGKVHRILNRSTSSARYLVVQGPGAFDYIAVESATV